MKRMRNARVVRVTTVSISSFWQISMASGCKKQEISRFSKDGNNHCECKKCNSTNNAL